MKGPDTGNKRKRNRGQPEEKGVTGGKGRNEKRNEKESEKRETKRSQGKRRDKPAWDWE